MTRISAATTVSDRFDHVSGIEALRGAITITHRCDSLAELISVARTGLVDVVVVAGDTDDLGRNFLESTNPPGAQPVAVVGLSDIPAERDRLVSIGVPAENPERSPDELSRWLIEAARAPSSPPLPRTTSELDGPGRPENVDDWNVLLAQESSRASEAISENEPSEQPFGPNPQQTSRRSGEKPVESPAQRTTIAVWGPIGAPGRSTVALNLAVEYALSGHETLLIDLDTYGPAIGAMLGMLDDAAGIAQACRAAERAEITGEKLGSVAVAAHIAGVRLDVLTGLTRPERWPEVRVSSLEQVLTCAADHWEVVILDCGFGLEEDAELSFDVPAPQRNAATLAGLRAADRIIALGTGDPVGLPRLIRGLDELAEHEMSGLIDVVVNKVSAATSGVGPQAQIRGVWNRYGPRQEIDAFLPEDRKAASVALFGGQVLAEAAPKSPLRSAVAELAKLKVAARKSSSRTASGPEQRPTRRARKNAGARSLTVLARRFSRARQN